MRIRRVNLNVNFTVEEKRRFDDFCLLLIKIDKRARAKKAIKPKQQRVKAIYGTGWLFNQRFNLSLFYQKFLNFFLSYLLIHLSLNYLYQYNYQ